MRKIKTIAVKIDEMLADYERLNREAHAMLDLYLDEVRLAYPYTPTAALKQTEFAKAGSTWNVPEMLRILKERKCSPRKV
jgi:hypothetical protein